MSARASLADALAELLGLAPPVSREGPKISARAGDLELAVTLLEDAALVELSGWQRRFELADADDRDDQAALLLDLIGAALFGDARVVVERFGGRPRRATLQVRREGAWQTVDSCGARPWNPFARAEQQVLAAAIPRPPTRASAATPSLPWAPWAGLAGYYSAPTDEPPAAELPVDGELDLHNFRPREVGQVVRAYLDACVARGIREVRIVHGKGIGNLRRTVHAVLERHPRVAGYRLGGHREGSWGATLVDLDVGARSRE